MATKATVLVRDIVPKDVNMFTAQVTFASFPDGIGLSGHMDVDLDSRSLAANLQAAVADGVKAYLQGQGIVFDVGDSVRFLGTM